MRCSLRLLSFPDMSLKYFCVNQLHCIIGLYVKCRTGYTLDVHVLLLCRELDAMGSEDDEKSTTRHCHWSRCQKRVTLTVALVNDNSVMGRSPITLVLINLTLSTDT